MVTRVRVQDGDQPHLQQPGRVGEGAEQQGGPQVQQQAGQTAPRPQLQHPVHQRPAGGQLATAGQCYLLPAHGEVSLHSDGHHQVGLQCEHDVLGGVEEVVVQPDIRLSL